jgi:beta-glucosidase
VAADGADAARVALNAGTDSEMVSTNFVDFGKQLLASLQISMRRINDAVRRILRVKFRAGLFEHPYVDWQ